MAKTKKAAPTNSLPAPAPAPAPGERMFFSDTGEDIRVGLPDGGVAVVGATPRTLPPRFHRAAARAGCLIVGSAPVQTFQQGPEAMDPTERIEAIKNAIQTAIEADPGEAGTEKDHDAYNAKYGDAFNSDEKPNLRWLEATLGFPLSATERDQAWNELRDELELDKDEPDTGAESGGSLE